MDQFRWLRRVGLSAACSLLSLACLTSAWAQAAEPPDVPEGYSKKTQQWFQTVERGHTLRVVNPFGRIYGRFGGYENKAEILGTVQRLESDKPELSVTFKELNGDLEVRVGPVAGKDGSPPPAAQSFKTRDRIDLVVFVPMEVTLDAETRDDLIAVKGLKGNFSGKSFKGDLQIRSVGGHVEATTERGQISAHLGTDVTDRPQKLTTVTGDIEAYLWADANVNVRIATSGEISTDFSLEIEHRDKEEPGKYARATVGKGGAELSLLSKRGRVRLLRLPERYEPDDDAD